MPSISIAIATFNEEQNLDSCLSSVAGVAREIVLVDGGSSDKTVEIARHFKAKVITTDNPPIFHVNKQKALDACQGDWILQLDADEIVTTELAQEINETVKSGTRTGYYIPRKNYFLGHLLQKGGQYPDYVIRLFRRGKGRFPTKSVHEQIVIDGKVGYLKEPLLHYSYRTVGEYWKKADTYITLESREIRKPARWFDYYMVKPVATFVSLFVRHKGFMDGVYGFLFALFSALHFPLAYRKFMKTLAIIMFLITFGHRAIFADYVLPYPSYMPGNKLYRISRIADQLKQWWYWGTIAQTKYHLMLADKYLVEAKTLFEYHQYLLAVLALSDSDKQFQLIGQRTPIIREASDKHIETLKKIKTETPEVFIWTPEKSKPTTLAIWQILDTSIVIRQNVQ